MHIRYGSAADELIELQLFYVLNHTCMMALVPEICLNILLIGINW
jgi:hypothetical protein